MEILSQFRYYPLEAMYFSLFCTSLKGKSPVFLDFFLQNMHTCICVVNRLQWQLGTTKWNALYNEATHLKLASNKYILGTNSL